MLVITSLCLSGVGCQPGYEPAPQVARLTPTGTNNAYELSSTILGTGTALSFPSSINADYAGNVWVTSSNFNDNTGSTSVYKIATGNAASADPVSGLTFASSTYVGAWYCLVQQLCCQSLAAAVCWYNSSTCRLGDGAS